MELGDSVTVSSATSSFSSSAPSSSRRFPVTFACIHQWWTTFSLTLIVLVFGSTFTNPFIDATTYSLPFSLTILVHGQAVFERSKSLGISGSMGSPPIFIQAVPMTRGIFSKSLSSALTWGKKLANWERSTLPSEWIFGVLSCFIFFVASTVVASIHGLASSCAATVTRQDF